MSRASPPTKGEEIVLRQEWQASEFGPNSYDENGRRRMVVRHIPATVVYVRRRGDFDVETEGGSRHRVGVNGFVEHVRGTLRVLYRSGARLRPDQLPTYLEDEARRAA